MPYTPPSHSSPSVSKTNSPALSRSSSYSEDAPRSPAIGRPPPRSMSSASYLHKHRRSPSISKSDGPPTPTEVSECSIQVNDFAQNSSSVRQSPPPVNNNVMPNGAMLSPPDSSENSDGDEAPRQERGRELERNWDELRQAVRGLEHNRDGSPDKVGMAREQQHMSEPTSETTSPTALTQHARKAAHSRSSTETKIVIPKAAFELPNETSEGSDGDNEDGEFSKPALVRKKSGELVKPALRPSSRRRYSSMPGTPTYSKSVHFNEDVNQTKHFLQVDKPIAVSAGTSPVEAYDSESEFPFSETKAEREMKLANFPADTFERKLEPIRVERIFLSADKQTLVGVCAVQNISFHKLVVARFTLDYWKTTSEVVAEYNNDPRNPTTDGCDRFNFHIKLSDAADIDNKTLLLCVRYNVAGQEFWDNNENTNYRIDFSKMVKKSSKPSLNVNGLGTRPLNAIPRSRHSPPSSSRGRQESLDDDFAARFDNSSAYHFGSTDQLLGESPSSIKLKRPTKRGSIFPAPGSTQPTNGLGGRYDFGASLSAALSSAQDKLGRSSGLLGERQKSNGGSYFGPVERTEGPVKANQRPDELTTDRPAMGSDQYKDLVQKFCYVGSSNGTKPSAVTTKFQPGPTFSGKPAPASPSVPRSIPRSTPAKPAAKTDGANDNDGASTTSSSGTTSPSAVLDGSNERAASPALSPFMSRSGSPTPATGGGLGARSASPISFGYPYHNNTRDGYLSDSSMTPTAIHG